MRKPGTRPDYDAIRNYTKSIPDGVKSIRMAQADDGSGMEIVYDLNGSTVRKVVPFKSK